MLIFSTVGSAIAARRFFPLPAVHATHNGNGSPVACRLACWSRWARPAVRRLGRVRRLLPGRTAGGKAVAGRARAGRQPGHATARRLARMSSATAPAASWCSCLATLW